MIQTLLDTTRSRSRAGELPGIDEAAVRAHPLSGETLRALRYMQDIESHTVVYLRTLLSTRAIDDPEISSFLALWFYEETFHGLLLARFLEAAGAGQPPRPRSAPALGERLRAAGAALLSRAWPAFPAVHMLWGAINELTTLTGYRRLAAVARHPALSQLLARVIQDESRHFRFYFHAARRRLADPRTARIARALVERFWAPVGSGVQPDAEVRFLAGYLFTGSEGRAAARQVDSTIRSLPGLAELPLFDAWLDGEFGPGREPAGSAQLGGGRSGRPALGAAV
jgi:hypothetical protein